MIILSLIVGGLLMALMGTFLWVLYDFKKYKKENHLILLFLLFFPASLFAQVVDKDNCQVSFRWLDNQQGELKYVENDCVFRFVPDELSWTISVSNNSSNTLVVDWSKVQFVNNGFNTAVILNPAGSGETSESISTVPTGQTVSKSLASLNSQDRVSVNRMYDVRKLKKGTKASSTIILPISMKGTMKSYINFDFIIEYNKR